MHRPKNIWHLIAKRPFIALVAVLLFVVQAVFQVTEVIVLESFIDHFSSLSWQKVIIFVVLLSGIHTFSYMKEPMLAYLKDKIRLRVRAYLDRVMIEKAARISVEALESADHQALLKRLWNEPEKRYVNGFFSILQILGGLLGMAGIFSFIMGRVPFFLPVILVLLGLMVVSFRFIGKNKVAMYQTRQEIGRRSEYLSGILFERRLAQEKKLFDYTNYIQKLYEEETIQSGKKMIKNIFFTNMVLWIYDNITYLFSASAYLLFLIPLYRGEIDIGLYIAIIPALTRLGTFFVAVGSSHLPIYKEYQACYKDMEKFYYLPEQYYIYEERSAQPSFHVIKGESIVFRYPGQEKPVLDGLDFSFYIGKNYALVGENGCGKSTLIKLLMGFYKPESGSITIDGKDIQHMAFAELQHYFSAVFQDFNRYDYTIEENIFISRPGGKNEQDMQQALQQAEFDQWVLSCPDTYKTKLGNLEEGGTDLSGGQWQRLSIARMLYRKADIYIWDEPTAAMDPLAESRLYTAFLKKRSDQCANIFVTHRLGAAVSADEICVMENGRFVEQGSHTELMKKTDGLYQQMFQAQKGMYQ